MRIAVSIIIVAIPFFLVNVQMLSWKYVGW